MENIPLPADPINSLDNSSKPKFFPKKNTFRIVGMIVVLVVAYFLFFSAPKNFPAGQVIIVEPGVNLHRLSAELKDAHIIRSKIVFETFVVFYGGERHLAPGDYLFENDLSVFEVARRISYGERHLAPIKVTIPEGFNVTDIANAFTLKLSSFKKDVFLLEAKQKEGYLFPDTYFFFTTSNEQDVLNSMSANFEKRIASVRPEIISMGKSEKEIITMASIIEREAKGNADRGIISGILWNRIAKGMLLQVDAAPNTYKIKGLPNNPICNPGIESIKAAIHPKNSPYLFYLHDKGGMIHYARTFAEHKANIAKYLK